MQTKIHIFTHSMYLSRRKSTIRKVLGEFICGYGFVRTRVNVILVHDPQPRHPWDRVVTASVSMLIMASASWTVLPLSVSCRSPDASAYIRAVAAAASLG